MRITNLASLIVVIISVATIDVSGQSGDDYKVYSAVIRYLFRDRSASIELIVIRDQTFSKYARTTENWREVKSSIPTLTDETIASYDSIRKSEQKLDGRLDLSIKYQLISDEQVRSIFPEPQNHERMMESWKRFYGLYPKSGGYKSLSRVGYDGSGRQAIVYVVTSCGELCANGTYVVLQKGENGWEAVGRAIAWIS